MEKPASQSRTSGARAGLRRYLGWPTPLALIWLLAPIVGVVIRLSLAPVAPYDYWWSMAMGKLIELTGRIPTENLFLFTLPADEPFFDQPWLSQWVMYLTLEQFGHVGPVVMRNVIAGLTWLGLMIGAHSRARDPRVLGALGLLAVAASAPVFTVRTQIFAFIPFVILLAVIFSVADARLRRPWLLLLAPLTLLWANLHGTFVLVPVLVGLAGGSLVVERWLDAREFESAEFCWWGGTTILVGLAAMLNPRGAGIYAYVVELAFVSEVSNTVTEWQPPDISSAYGAMVMLVLAASLVVLGMRRKQARLFEVVLFAATAYLAMGAIRQMFWWAAIFLMVMPRHLRDLLRLEPWWKSSTTPKQGIVHASMALLMLSCVLLSQPGWPVHRVGVEVLEGSIRRSGPGRGLLGKANPTRIVRGLAERGYPGRIFHSQEVGGHLEYALATRERRRVAFVDQRMELIPQRIWNEYFGVSAAIDGWRGVLEKYDIRTLLLTPDEQAPLIQAVQADPAWTLVAVDEMHLLFFRADQTEAITRWRSAPSET